MSDNNDNFFKDLCTVEEDSKQLESIERLQQAFREVRQAYRDEYNDSMSHILKNIKTKMQHNRGMVDAVNSYVNQFVLPGDRVKATDALYDLLAAEMLHTVQTLQHTSCNTM